jgi:ubiquinone/menaquinone biosynthesis C-methylase UbiE
MNSKTANYGIDGPVFVFNTFLLGCFLFFGGLAITLLLHHSKTYEILAALAVVAGAICFWIGATILWGSLVGKLRLRDKVFENIQLRGDEKILGVGCGHGLLLVAAAKQLDKGGKTFGVDIWKSADQAGNSPQATRRNAEIEGVAKRLEITTADARRLPFADAAFDLIGSSWVLHNIIRPKERKKALAEIVRVLKPGGTILIIDVWLGYEYAAFFRRAGLENVTVSRPYFLFFAPTFIVRATKKQLSVISHQSSEKAIIDNC